MDATNLCQMRIQTKSYTIWIRGFSFAFVAICLVFRVSTALAIPGKTHGDTTATKDILPRIIINTGLGIKIGSVINTSELLKLVSIESGDDWLDIIKQLEFFQKNLFDGSRQATLRDLLIESVNNNPQLDVAFESIQSQDALVASAKRQWNPSVGISALGGYSWQTLSNYPLNKPSLSTQPSPSSTYTDNSLLSTSLGLSWYPYLATRQPLIRSQAAALDQQKLLFIIAARDTILNTQLAYTSVQKALELIKAFSSIVETDIAILNQIRKNKQAGLSSQADIEQQKTQLYQDLITLIDAYLSLDNAQNELGKALGQVGHQYIVPQDQFVPIGSWDQSLNQTIDMALKMREEIKASAKLAESLGWNAKKIIASYLPSFSLNANTSILANKGIIAQELWGLSPSINKQLNTTLTLSANITWNLYDGGVNLSLARSQERLAKQALDTARLQKAQISADAASSFTNYRNSQISIFSAKRAVQAAKNATAIYRVRYSVGVDTITPLVLSIKSLSDSTTSLASAIELHNNSINRLYRNTSTWPDYTGVSLSDVLIMQLKNGRP
ncbi:MAG: TolC family protein [Cyanobacteria bacterium K_Offshore_surface_m2_239]|nr:TolC family protein [Cyanobacteria bacterium K_Offshore_surface_m2_239]